MADHREIREAAREYVRWLGNTDYDTRDAEEIVSGLTRHAEHVLPSDAVLAYVRGEEGSPLLAAAVEEAPAVYLFEAAPFDRTREQNRSFTCRAYPLTSRSCRVEITSRFVQSYGQVLAITRWEFDLDPIGIVCDSSTDPDERGAQAFARTLMGAMGLRHAPDESAV